LCNLPEITDWIDKGKNRKKNTKNLRLCCNNSLSKSIYQTPEEKATTKNHKKNINDKDGERFTVQRRISELNS
jgi:hypothetical protein